MRPRVVELEAGVHGASVGAGRMSAGPRRIEGWNKGSGAGGQRFWGRRRQGDGSSPWTKACWRQQLYVQTWGGGEERAWGASCAEGFATGGWNYEMLICIDVLPVAGALAAVLNVFRRG